jgi:IclR family mhp operon transcriptional activator
MIDRKVKSIRALERGIDVLQCIRLSRGMSLHELHQQTGLSKATLLRIIVTLSSRGLVWQRIGDGAYLPGTIAAVSDGAELHERLAEIASPYMVELSRKALWPSVLAAPRLDHVEIVETNGPVVRLDSAVLGPVGFKLSYIHTATGRAYLAACAPDERRAIIDRLRPKGATAEAEVLLEEILALTRRQGYAARDPVHPWPDRSKILTMRDGRRSIAVPVMAQGQAVASLNLTWPARRTTIDDITARHLGTLQATAREIGHALESSPQFSLGETSGLMRAAALRSLVATGERHDRESVAFEERGGVA